MSMIHPLAAHRTDPRPALSYKLDVIFERLFHDDNTPVLL